MAVFLLLLAAFICALIGAIRGSAVVVAVGLILAVVAALIPATQAVF